ncbi:MAG: branched-chain amino acid ABC transporter permease [Acidibacillus sp.]|uniref:High-affinity branched-chain amino acid transport system permease protein LivH n=1 Tax=Sulfoacidibacillus ferrooxidans TaxID=2005001 RepID=A0A9X2ADR9_9BACL|nr:branched-chain amino acid ABC transporter permease [Sulfoacidibacillus ferrooxidans]MCI0183760.1 High-affinity branched-chain amino acid transport system permease protein LivH [Sulfoacidibacillus ferrooxidans]MCY0892203.1 branched-chain amino acid ABC transporter permease [Acidibacillus sp.]
MNVFLTLALDGISTGALYFLMAAGLTLIFGLLRVINFAHGGIFVWGAYAATFMYSASHQFIWSLLIGTLVGGLLGWLMETGLISAVYGDGNQQLLVTMGILIVLTEIIQILFGRDPVLSEAPPFLNHSWIIGHVILVEYPLFTIVMAAIVFGLLMYILRKTRLGLIIRAGVDNRALVEARGIPIRRIFTVVFILGAALAGFAGALSGPYYGAVTPSMGLDMQLNAFIIVVLGGLGSLIGSLVGSLLIGLATAIVSYYTPSFAVLANVLLMTTILLIRPQGLFGEGEID